NGVMPSGEDANAVAAVYDRRSVSSFGASAVIDRRYRKFDLGAFTSSDPVSLQKLDPFGPIEIFQFVGEALGKGRDPQHPLPHRPANNRETAHFTFAVNDLLV